MVIEYLSKLLEDYEPTNDHMKDRVNLVRLLISSEVQCEDFLSKEERLDINISTSPSYLLSACEDLSVDDKIINTSNWLFFNVISNEDYIKRFTPLVCFKDEREFEDWDNHSHDSESYAVFKDISRNSLTITYGDERLVREDRFDEEFDFKDELISLIEEVNFVSQGKKDLLMNQLEDKKEDETLKDSEKLREEVSEILTRVMSENLPKYKEGMTEREWWNYKERHEVYSLLCGASLLLKNKNSHLKESIPIKVLARSKMDHRNFVEEMDRSVHCSLVKYVIEAYLIKHFEKIYKFKITKEIEIRIFFLGMKGKVQVRLNGNVVDEKDILIMVEDLVSLELSELSY